MKRWLNLNLLWERLIIHSLEVLSRNNPNTGLTMQVAAAATCRNFWALIFTYSSLDWTSELQAIHFKSAFWKEHLGGIFLVRGLPMPWRVLVKFQIHNLHHVMDLIMRSVGMTWNSFPFQATDLCSDCWKEFKVWLPSVQNHPHRGCCKHICVCPASLPSLCWICLGWR